MSPDVGLGLIGVVVVDDDVVGMLERSARSED